MCTTICIHILRTRSLKILIVFVEFSYGEVKGRKVCTQEEIGPQWALQIHTIEAPAQSKRLRLLRNRCCRASPSRITLIVTTTLPHHAHPCNCTPAPFTPPLFSERVLPAVLASIRLALPLRDFGRLHWLRPGKAELTEGRTSSIGRAVGRLRTDTQDSRGGS